MKRKIKALSRKNIIAISATQAVLIVVSIIITTFWPARAPATVTFLFLAACLGVMLCLDLLEAGIAQEQPEENQS